MTSNIPVPLMVDCENACSCGRSRFRVSGRLLTRFICHCRICQSVYKAPFADVTVYSAPSVVLLTPGSLSLKRYRLPPAVNRGSCKHCGDPVLGYMTIAPLMKLGFVPAQNLSGITPLPPPAFHIFYHRRIADSFDDLPKHCGYWNSEFATAREILRQWFT